MRSPGSHTVITGGEHSLGGSAGDDQSALRIDRQSGETRDLRGERVAQLGRAPRHGILVAPRVHRVLGRPHECRGRISMGNPWDRLIASVACAATRDISRMSDSVKTDVRREVRGMRCGLERGGVYWGIFNSMPIASELSLGRMLRLAVMSRQRERLP